MSSHRKKKLASNRPVEQGIKGNISLYLKSTKAGALAKNASLLLKSPIVRAKYYRKKNINIDLLYSKTMNGCPKGNLWLWAFKVLLKKYDTLIQYIENEEQLTKFIIERDLEKAKKLSEEIDKKNGASIKHTKIYFQILHNLGIKTDALIEDIKDPILKYITKKSVERVNNNDGLFEYKLEKFINEIENSSLSSSIKQLIAYQVFPIDPYITIDFTILLRYEINTSIIDLFELIKNTIKYNDNIDEEILNSISYLTLEERKKLNDILKYSITDIENITEDDIEYTKILDCCVGGKPIDEKEFPLLTFPLPISILSNILNSEVDFKTKGNKNDIIEKLKNLLNRTEDYKESKEWLLSLAYSYRALPWFKQLWLLVNSEDKYIQVKTRERYRKYLLSNSPNTPEKLEILDDDSKIKLLYNLKTRLKSSTSIYFYSQLYLENKIDKLENKLDAYHKGFCRAFSSLNSGDYRKSEIISKEISYRHTGRKKLNITSLYISSLLKQNKFDEAIKYFVESFISNPSQSSYIDLSNIIDSFDTSYLNSSLIDYPIILSIYKDLISDDKTTDLETSIEVFLELNNLHLPLDIIHSKQFFDFDKSRYFLKNVCKTRTLESLIEISSEEEAKQYRIKLCQYLIETGETSKKISIELVELMRQKLLKKLKKQVDSSRIYVDSSVFLGAQSQTYRALFERYMALRNTYNSKNDIYYDVFKALDKQTEDTLILAGNLFILEKGSDDEDIEKRKNIFYSIATLFRDVFINGEKGLNNYISTRIRHGVLPTELRSSIISENLYIAEDSDPKNWSLTKDMDEDDSESRSFLYEKITNISRSYDAIINEVNNEYLQFETLSKEALNFENKNSKRLFSYTILPFECYVLEQNLSPIPTYDELVKTIVDFLWKKTERNLENIRHSMITEIQDKLKSTISKLKAEIKGSEINESLKSDLFNRADRSINRLSSTMEQVSKWFTISNESNYSDCFVEDVVEISSEAVGVKVKVSTNNIKLKIRGEYISYFVDFITILIENSVSKSGIQKSEIDLIIEFEKSHSGGVIITSSNLCSDEVIAKNEYKFYEDAYGDEDLTKDVIQQEGGSGLFKIWNLLYKVLGIKHRMKITKENSRFIVEFNLDKSESLTWL
ncbi:hypothetical protein [Thalassolituus oleivorans]|uniref:hypothetical protein n=1 Tax=Thalassolituus oleivorans TaxID=187493 RepID=UPI001CE385BE|nr:hypothetical protein [Thalassolituus oleivorans]